MTAALDAWLPEHDLRTRHRREAPAAPDDLWTAATGVRIGEARRLGRVVRWRLPGTPPELTFRELFASEPFVVLEEGERASVSGLCGRIWTLTRDYPRLADPGAFARWDEPGTVRVAFGHWVEAAGDGRSAIVSEARVQAIDRSARLRLKALWAIVGAFERLIGAEPLAIAARRAERS
jgi:hypothetical protein